MRERPILFSAPMVRAILEGRKTQTRRVVKFNDAGRVQRAGKQWHLDDPAAKQACLYGQPSDRLWVRETWQDVHPLQIAAGRYSQKGRAGIPGPPPVDYRTIYRADGEYPPIYSLGNLEHPYRRREPFEVNGICAFEEHYGWRTSIHMPRWASRITLEVTAVRVERLRAISEADAIAEGIHVVQIGSGYPDRYSPTPVAWADVIEQQAEAYEDPCVAYQDLWESINGAGSWAANPWVWVVEFRRAEVAHV